MGPKRNILLNTSTNDGIHDRMFGPYSAIVSAFVNFFFFQTEAFYKFSDENVYLTVTAAS